MMSSPSRKVPGGDGWCLFCPEDRLTWHSGEQWKSPVSQDNPWRGRGISTRSARLESSAGWLGMKAPTLCQTQRADGPPLVPEERESTCQINANLPFCCLSPQAPSLLLKDSEQGLFLGSGTRHDTACGHTPALLPSERGWPRLTDLQERHPWLSHLPRCVLALPWAKASPGSMEIIKRSG